MNNDLPAIRPILRRANAFNYGNDDHNVIPLYVTTGMPQFPLDIHLHDAPHWYNHFMTERDNGRLDNNHYNRLLNVVNRYNEINQANPIIIHHHFRSRKSQRKSQKKSSSKSPRKSSRKSQKKK